MCAKDRPIRRQTRACPQMCISAALVCYKWISTKGLQEKERNILIDPGSMNMRATVTENNTLESECSTFPAVTVLRGLTGLPVILIIIRFGFLVLTSIMLKVEDRKSVV